MKESIIIIAIGVTIVLSPFIKLLVFATFKKLTELIFKV